MQVPSSVKNAFGSSDQVLWRAFDSSQHAHSTTYSATRNPKTSTHTPRLINLESDEWHVAHATNLKEENKLIEAGFEYVRYSDKDQVAIYRKPKQPDRAKTKPQ